VSLSLPQWGQWMTLILIAIALGMDAFSLGVGLGLRGIRRSRALMISGVIGMFHVLLPLFGMGLGRYVSTLVGNLAAIVGGGLLCFLGVNMLVQGFRGSAEGTMLHHNSFWGMMLFALSVSLDSLSAGLSLGLFHSNVIGAALLSGVSGGTLGILGMAAGRRAGTWIGEYGEILGGVILLYLGVQFLW
jgi:manganese efflux pump family protein